jgi:PAS domain S-box-containing protein/putative nucleotidyltransferase with HDIG domain
MQTQEILQALIKASPLAILILDPSGNILVWNRSAERIFGWRAEEVVGSSAPFVPENRKDEFASLRKRVAGGESFLGVELLRQRKDGALIDVSLSAAPLKNPAGQFVGIMAMLDDITQRKKAREETRNNLNLLRAIMEGTTDIIYVKDLEGRYLMTNSAGAHLVGKEADEVIGRTDHDLFPKRIADRIREADEQVIESGNLKTYEETIHVGERSPTFSTTKNALRDHCGEIIGLLGISRDITDRRKTEESLRESEERYSSLFQNNQAAMLLIDPQTERIIDANPAACSFYGWSRQELTAKRISEINVLSEEEVEREMQRARSKGIGHYHFRHRLASGELRDVEAYSGTIVTSGKPFLYSIIHDVTERRQRTRELEAITAVTTALRSARNHTEMHPLILDSAQELLQAEGAAVYRLDQESKEIVVEQARGRWAAITGDRFPQQLGIASEVFRSGRPCFNADGGKMKHCNCRGFADTPTAVTCLPLLANEEVIGVLSIGRKRGISEAEMRILHSIGDIAASAIHRSTLFEQTEKQLQRLSALRNIDMAITGSMDLRVTLNILLEQVVGQLHIDAADVLLYRPRTGILEFAAGRGFRTTRITKTRLGVGESCAGSVVYERRMISIPDFSDSTETFIRNTLVKEEGFVSYHAIPLVAKGEVKGVLEIFHRSPLIPTEDWLDYLESLSMQAALAVENASLFEELQRSNTDLRLAYDHTIEGWSRALDLRDKETEGHSIRVTEITLRLARDMGMNEEELVHVRRGALLHDIGKMGIPDHILNKPGKLTSEEWEIMKNHPVLAFKLLSPIAYLRPALDIAYCHHEKWDGSGYPRGLKGEEIPLAARVFALIDVWDALSSDRPYRPAWPKEKVRAYLRENSGAHFDPEVVEMFMTMDVNERT